MSAIPTSPDRENTRRQRPGHVSLSRTPDGCGFRRKPVLPPLKKERAKKEKERGHDARTPQEQGKQGAGSTASTPRPVLGTAPHGARTNAGLATKAVSVEPGSRGCSPGAGTRVQPPGRGILRRRPRTGHSTWLMETSEGGPPHRRGPGRKKGLGPPERTPSPDACQGRALAARAGR